jgi:hypothetical protein
MYVKDGRKLYDRGFTLGKGDERVSFPPHWLSLASDDDLARYGIERLPDPEPAPPTPPYVPTPDDLERDFTSRVEARLEDFARMRNYDSMDKARLAALSDEYAADGRIANAAYDTTWAAAIALISDVRDGTLTPEEAIGYLPEISWEEIPENLVNEPI